MCAGAALRRICLIKAELALMDACWAPTLGDVHMDMAQH